MNDIIDFYLRSNEEFIEELEERTPEEKAYDEVIIKELRNGKKLKAALKKAAKKFLQEALQVDESNIKDVKAHYEYLVGHQEVLERIDKIRKKEINFS